MITISGRVERLQSNNALAAIPAKKVYLLPSRTDFQFSIDGGTTWQNWQGDIALLSTYPGAISATTNATGDWSFTVPWTDDATEFQLPLASPTPALKWNIIDPNPSTGIIVYAGETPTSDGTAATIQELTALPDPDTWTVSSVTYRAVPVGPRRFVTIEFTSVTVAALSMDNIGTSDWKFGHGIETDDTVSKYSVTLDTASKTATAGTFYLSDVPPAGKTVKAHIEAYT